MLNQDFQYDKKDGDTWEDGNGNGKFDKVFIAGFHNKKPAQDAHDDLWARTMVIDDGTTRMAIVALDLIGLGADEVIRIRKALAETTQVDYVIVTATHTHNAPDVIGLWGEGMFSSGLDKNYLQFVRDQATQSIIQAVEKMRPAKLRFAQDLDGAKDLVMDTRMPIVIGLWT